MGRGFDRLSPNGWGNRNAHGDRARPGNAHYIATAISEGVLRARLGADIALQTLAYGEAIDHHGVKLSLHPAGHVLGSAQVRLEHAGRVWVASGDDNATCAPFEPTRPGPCTFSRAASPGRDHRA